MSLVHEQSCECMKSELDLFAIPPTQTNVEEGQYIEHRPVSALSENTPIEFLISGSGDDYLDLSKSLLQIQFRIKKLNGDNLDGGQEVAPVNNFLHSLFSQIDLAMNNKLISLSNNTYPYRAYIENLVSYGAGAKETQLTSAMWYKDTAGQMEARNGDNEGFEKRQTMTAESKNVDLLGRIHLDMFLQERYVINGVDMKLKLIRAKNVFCLVGDEDNYKVDILEAVLHVRKVRLSTAVRMAHIKALESGTAKYPIRRVETKVFTVSAGHMNVTKENIFVGQLPKKIFIALVDNDAFNGIITKNPFNFKHHNINYFSLYMDGKQIPTKPLQPNFQRKRYIRSYNGLFEASGKLFQDEGNQISRDEFGEGYTLFGFDVSPDLSESDYFNLIKHGNMSLEIHFTEATGATISVIIYGEFENIIEIDKNRNIIFDYST